MGGFHRVGHLDPELEQLGRCQRSSVEDAVQRPAVEIFHDDEVPVLDLPDVVNCADVGVVEHGRRPSLALEALDHTAVTRRLVGQKLQRDFTAEPGVHGPVHNTHTATADSLQDSVMRDRLPDKRIGCRHLPTSYAARRGQVNEADRGDAWCRGPETHY